MKDSRMENIRPGGLVVMAVVGELIKMPGRENGGLVKR